jgi:hypothetical protein
MQDARTRMSEMLRNWTSAGMFPFGSFGPLPDFSTHLHGHGHHAHIHDHHRHDPLCIHHEHTVRVQTTSLFLYIREQLRQGKVRMNGTCSWTNAQLFVFIDEMKPYASATELNTFGTNDNVTWTMLLGHILPTPSLLETMVRFFAGADVLSVGAGQGLIEHMLHNLGVRVVSTDNQVWPWTYCTMEVLGAKEAVLAHPECDVLMLLWSDDTGYDATALAEFKGSRVVFAGCSPKRERPDVGSDAFWTAFRREWTVDQELVLACHAPKRYHPTCYFARRRRSTTTHADTCGVTPQAQQS